jgi:hypothetical protein
LGWAGVWQEFEMLGKKIMQKFFAPDLSVPKAFSRGYYRDGKLSLDRDAVG